MPPRTPTRLAEALPLPARKPNRKGKNLAFLRVWKTRKGNSACSTCAYVSAHAQMCACGSIEKPFQPFHPFHFNLVLHSFSERKTDA